VDVNLNNEFLDFIEEIFDHVDMISRPIPKSILLIKEAQYFKRKDRRYSTNVTLLLKKKLGNNSFLHIDPHGYNAVFGDPYRFYNKGLTVTYVHFGQEETITIKESQALDIPPKE